MCVADVDDVAGVAAVVAADDLLTPPAPPAATLTEASSSKLESLSRLEYRFGLGKRPDLNLESTRKSSSPAREASAVLPPLASSSFGVTVCPLPSSFIGIRNSLGHFFNCSNLCGTVAILQLSVSDEFCREKLLALESIRR